VRSGEFRMTQEFLSHMLGVRRVGVTEAATALQRRKLIEYRRGNITILDHRGLEKAACTCYESVNGLRDWEEKGSARRRPSAANRPSVASPRESAPATARPM